MFHSLKMHLHILADISCFTNDIIDIQESGITSDKMSSMVALFMAILLHLSLPSVCNSCVPAKKSHTNNLLHLYAHKEFVITELIQ